MPPYRLDWPHHVPFDWLHSIFQLNEVPQPGYINERPQALSRIQCLFKPMGQYWQIINLDKRETLGLWGKLGELLFDGSPSYLIQLFAIPIRPLKTYHDDIISVGWAGDRIICVGDNIEDYPRRVLTDGEWEELKEGDNTPENLSDLAERSYKDAHGMLYRTPDFSNKHMWILRNLSKREYVRANAVAPGSSNPGDPCVPIGRFGEVIVSRICWSSDADAAMSEKVDITRGVWAGDRFDINTTESLEVMDGGADWKDVSEEVAEEMFRIWESEYENYGDIDWREKWARTRRVY